MKITNVLASAEIAAPRPNPIRDALQLLDGGGVVRVRIETDSGVAGESTTSFTGDADAAASGCSMMLRLTRLTFPL